MSLFYLRFVCLVPLVLSVSCSSNSTDSTVVPTIENSGWKLSSYKIANQIERAIFDNGALSFFLQSRTSIISGFIECNAYSGSYVLDGDLLSISEVASDDEDCTEDNEHYREQRLLIQGALTQQLEVSVEGDELTFSTSDGNIMYFGKYSDVFIAQPEAE